ncbi:MAG: YceI family protein [Bacteroidetes bacterium]|nr:YceI family protein [Bacteroidota bacterium]
MKLSSLIYIITLALLAPITGSAQAINQDSSMVTFELSNLGINTVEGTITGFEGIVFFDADDLSESIFDVCIDPATVNSGIAVRDRALLEEDYFGVEIHPQICYRSDQIVKTKEGFVSNGTLTMKGISREVSIPFVSKGNELTGSLEINRTDYNVGPANGFLVGKTVNLTIICVLETNNP